MAASEILQTVKVLFAPGDVMEVRLKHNGKWFSGYYDFNHFDKLVTDVEIYDKLPGTEAVYFTPNPVQNILLARCSNRIERATITTSDDHTKHRRFLLLDIDPERPAGTSSTDDQHQQSINIAYEVAKKMKDDYGWPCPIIGDSGNGAHLMYPIDELNTPAAKDLVDNAISAIIQENECSDGIKIEKWSNAARIWKLYGTMTRKGDELPDMGIHHRRSKILYVPDNIEVVATEQLEQMAVLFCGEPAKEQKKEQYTQKQYTGDKLEAANTQQKEEIAVMGTEVTEQREVISMMERELGAQSAENREMKAQMAAIQELLKIGAAHNIKT